jgi:hypothetical protein
MRVSFERGLGAVLAVLSLFASRHARADARVVTIDGRTWPDVVASFEADVDSVGRGVALCVRDDDSACVPCGSYTLAFDEVGARAFRVDACDASARTTLVTLVDRSALFDHTHAVPRPLTVTLHAEMLRAIDTSGGAASTGGSSLGCTARARPYLRDLEHATNVYLGPDQYDVRVERAGVQVTTLGDGWMIVSETQIASDVDYDVIERASGEIVMSGHASLECASDTITTIDARRRVARSGTMADASIEGAGFEPVTLFGVAGVNGERGNRESGCVGHFLRLPQHVLDVEDEVGDVEIRALASVSGDLTVAIRTSDGAWHCNDDGGRQPNTLDPLVDLTGLTAGTVEVWVGTYYETDVIPYRLDVHEVVPAVIVPPPPPIVRHRAQPGLLFTGVVASAASGVFSLVFDLFPEMMCPGGTGCPNTTWRSAQWIPFIGPWISQGLDGADGGVATAPAIVDGVLQDLGLVAMITSVIAQEDRPVAVALGDAPDAPRMRLGGGAGSAVGATLTF